MSEPKNLKPWQAEWWSDVFEGFRYGFVWGVVFGCTLAIAAMLLSLTAGQWWGR